MRVLPRDAFNEANFLKCIAKLTMDLEDGLHSWLKYEYDGEPFNLNQDGNGCLFINNMHFYIDAPETNMFLYVARPLNSREAWPLYIETENGATYPIFDDKGNVILKQEDIA